MVVPSYREELISQIPAAQLLINLGYEYLTPSQALEMRGRWEWNVVGVDPVRWTVVSLANSR